MENLTRFNEGFSKIIDFVPKLYESAKALFESIPGPIGGYLIFCLVIGSIMIIFKVVNGNID